ncbi:hypothetical protein VTO58DRAFT_100616 [Aureobasidium pullulans]
MYDVSGLEAPPSFLYTAQPKGEQKATMVPHRHAGVFIARGKEDMSVVHEEHGSLCLGVR